MDDKRTPDVPEDDFEFLTVPLADEPEAVEVVEAVAAPDVAEPDTPPVAEPVLVTQSHKDEVEAPEALPEPLPQPEPELVTQSHKVEVPAPAPEKVSLLKREISFGRKPKQPAEPKAEKASVLKREVSFGRKPKEPKAPKAEKPKTQKAPTAKTLKAEKPAKAAKPPKQPKAPKPARKPRERKPIKLSLPSIQLPTRRAEGADGRRLKKVVGLKIGASQLAAAHVANNGSAELLKVARVSLEEGVIAGGELRDPEALTVALKAFFRKHKLPRRNVRLGIANNRIGVRTFEISGVDDPKQLANAVRFRAQEALPIPIEEAVLDWRILSERVDADGVTFRRILLVVAYREFVDRYVLACRRAGINLVGIDLEAFALLRALGDGQKRGADDGALVAVSVGHERSTFAVSDGEVCEFTRVLEWGGHSLSVAIARALDLTPSQVEEIKRGLALDGSPDNLPASVTEAQATKAREAVKRQLQTFARELVSSLQFYQNQPGSLGIGEIILTGGTAQLPGLDSELQRLIGVRVRVGDPLLRVKAKGPTLAEGLGSLSVAIGLGIED